MTSCPLHFCLSYVFCGVSCPVTTPKCTFRAFIDAHPNFHSFRGPAYDILPFTFMFVVRILRGFLPSDDTKVHFPSIYGCGFKLSQFPRARTRRFALFISVTLHIPQIIVPSDDTKVHFPSFYGCGFKLSQFLRARTRRFALHNHVHSSHSADYRAQ
jgi:hypothetical protein